MNTYFGDPEINILTIQPINDMKLISVKTILGLSGLLLMAACTNELVDSAADGARAISFTSAAETRAAVEGNALPADFKVWGGYDDPKSMTNIDTTFRFRIWKSIMSRIHAGLETKQFEMPTSVEQKTICTESGMLARPGCPSRTEYFATDNAPTDIESSQTSDTATYPDPNSARETNDPMPDDERGDEFDSSDSGAPLSEFGMSGEINLPEIEIKEIDLLGRVAVSKGVISLQNDRGTHYDTYIAVQNELTKVYNELRDEASQRYFQKPFNELMIKEQRDAIVAAIPISISEAEPRVTQ